MSGLEGVKVGDSIRCAKKFSSTQDLFTVERTTKTTAKCFGGVSFRIDSGLLIGSGGGSGWDRRRGYLVQGDELVRIRIKIRVRNAQERLRSLVVTPDNLEAVEAILKGAKP